VHIMEVNRCCSASGDGDTDDDDDNECDDKVYYTVRCGSCETVVAALDMKREIYHFSHCLASNASVPPVVKNAPPAQQQQQQQLQRRPGRRVVEDSTR
jgi:hypothetical protein